MKVLIIGSSKLPIPAVMGGAVPNLIEQIIRENEKEEKIDLSCCSLHNIDAIVESQKYTNTEFIWAEQPNIVKVLDNIVYLFLSKILRVKKLLSLSYVFQILWLIFYVGKLLKKRDFDQIIFENSIPLLLSLKLFGNEKKYTGRYHLHMHSVPQRLYGSAKLIKNCKSIICVSHYVADEILKNPKIGIRENQLRIMYNCIDTSLFNYYPLHQKISIREKYNIDADKKLILFVGRLCKEKGVEELFKAIDTINRTDVVLIVAGSNFYKSGLVSHYEHRLHTLVSAIKNNVIFTGYIDYSDLPQYYAAADIVVLPSMWEEPAGMTMLEAMACGKPMITTKSGGIPEYVGEGNCILLERDENIHTKIANEINTLLNDDLLRTTVANNAHHRASKFNMEYYYDQFLQILQE